MKDNIVNALGRFSHMFAGCWQPGQNQNPANEQFAIIAAALDKAAMLIAAANNIDYSSMIDKNLMENTEYPTITDLTVLLTTGGN